MCTGDAQSPTGEKWTQMNFVLMWGRSFWLVSTKSTLSLWSEKSGRDIFQAIMSHKRFHQISRVLRFDDKLSRPHDDKLSAFRKVWDCWMHRLELLFRDICVDEQLVPFRDRCNFKQYMPTKSAKYDLKIWAVCDVKTSYA